MTMALSARAPSLRAWALCALAASAPGVALAQPTAPAAAQPAPARPNRGASGRMMGEMLAGVGAGLGGVLVGGLLGYAGHTFATQDAPSSPDTAVVLGAGVGWLTALPLGVALFGAARDGDGGYGWSLLGAVGGTALGGAMGYVLDRGPSDGLAGAAGVGFFGGVVGALLGYELSCTGGLRGPPPRSRPAARRWMPSAGVSTTGVWAGVAGSF